jgi:hypothetical protein
VVDFLVQAIPFEVYSLIKQTPLTEPSDWTFLAGGTVSGGFLGLLGDSTRSLDPNQEGATKISST